MKILSGTSFTVNGGKDDDNILLTENSQNNLIQYASGDGNDTIEGFNSNDTLHITSGSISKTSVSGNDFIVYVDSGSMRFKDAVGSTLNLKIADGNVTTLKAEQAEETPTMDV